MFVVADKALPIVPNGNGNATQFALTKRPQRKHIMDELQLVCRWMLLRPPPQAEIARFSFDAPKERTAEAAGIGERMNMAERSQSRVTIQNGSEGRIGGHADYSSGMAIRRRMINRLFSPCAIVMLRDSSAG